MNNLEFKQALEKIHNKLLVNINKYDSVSPSPDAVNGMYSISNGCNWTDSFYVGTLWLDYMNTKNDDIKKCIDLQMGEFEQRLKQNRGLDDHDIGFLYILSAVAGAKLTSREEYKVLAIKAANLLSKRYHPEAKFIQAWGNPNGKENYRLIIDCMLNVPLLFWVGEQTDNKELFNIATQHSLTTMKTIIREDFSTYHTYYFDYDTKKPIYGKTKQGLTDNSTWSRGQAWAIYGFAIAYRYTKNIEFLNAAINVSKYFIEHLPEDLVCYWDLCFKNGTEQPRDTSASAIAVCGLLEIAQFCEDEGNKKYFSTYANKILLSLCSKYMLDEKYEAILDHATYSIPDNVGIDEACVWGDYFYTEALTRFVCKEFIPFW